MSVLIDELINDKIITSHKVYICKKWYIAKDIEYFSFKRIKEAYRVLIGKSRAYHFKEDEGYKEGY